jgi:zinc transporter
LSRYSREFGSLRSALARALSARRGVIESPLLEHLPGFLQDAEDFDRDAGALSDRARLLYEEVNTRLAAVTNRSLSALTVISTLLLPPTFVAGAFGMNVEGLPWAHDASGFAIVVGLCFVLIAAGWLVLRRFRILP